METILENKKSSALGGTLLVAGCCIGAGMLGLPVVSSLAGFVPSMLAMMLCGLFMAFTGLLILEAILCFEGEANLITLAGFVLGRAGKIIACSCFMFILYCLLVAYSAGGGELCADVLSAAIGTPVSYAQGIVVCVSLIGFMVYAGAKLVDHVNRTLMFGLVASYIALIIFGFSGVQTNRLLFADYPETIPMIPLLLVSFGYHNLVPTLVHYMKRNVKHLRLSIVIGSFLPFLIYTVWNAVILGLLPESQETNQEVANNKIEMVTGLLKAASGSPHVLLFANIFSICAIATSFLTNALSCIDFLRDGLKTENGPLQRVFYCLAVLIPPLLFALISPHLFLKALGYAGGFATVSVFGILPVLTVYKLRYVLRIEGPFVVPGGKGLLAVISMLCLIFLGLEFAQQIGFLKIGT